MRCGPPANLPMVNHGESVTNKVVLAALTLFVFIGSGAIYLFDFAGQALSIESLFWAAPLACPVAFLIYLKSQIGGTLIQTALYTSGILGAHRMIQLDCLRHNCSQFPTVFAAMLAGIHMIGMLCIVIIMCVGIWIKLRSNHAMNS